MGASPGRLVTSDDAFIGRLNHVQMSPLKLGKLPQPWPMTMDPVLKYFQRRTAPQSAVNRPVVVGDCDIEQFFELLERN